MARQPAGAGFPTLAEIKGNPIRGPKGQTPLTELALDLSSSCVGWACGANQRLERHGKFVFKTTSGIGEKLVSFEEYLDGLIRTYLPSTLLVERPSAYGKTNERHTELLGITRKVWYERTTMEIDPTWIIAPMTIKKWMRVEPGNTHDQNKILMLNKVNSLYRLQLKWDKGSKYKSDDDIADAIAVLTTHWRRAGGKKKGG